MASARGKLGGGLAGPANALWLRPLEDAGAAFRSIDAGLGRGEVSIVNSPNWSHLAIIQWGIPATRDQVLVTGFPSGEVVARWQMGDRGIAADMYSAITVCWSPDGTMLLMEEVAGDDDVMRGAMYLARLALVK